MLFFTEKHNFANNDSEIKVYVDNSKELKSKKKSSRIHATKSYGQEIKYFLKKNAENQSRKIKNKRATEKMKETGITTKDMVKNNRWFVKQPFQKSFKKISNIKRVKPSKIDTGINREISLMASDLTKTRARNTGSTKPEAIFSADSSRNVQILTKTLTLEAGPPKGGIIYSEDSSRNAMKISKNRSKVTGPVKPKRVYSDEVGRNAYKMTSKKNQKKINLKTTYTSQRYSIKFLKSLSRKSSLNNGQSNSSVKVNSDNSTEN